MPPSHSQSPPNPPSPSAAARRRQRVRHLRLCGRMGPPGRAAALGGSVETGGGTVGPGDGSAADADAVTADATVCVPRVTRRGEHRERGVLDFKRGDWGGLHAWLEVKPRQEERGHLPAFSFSWLVRDNSTGGGGFAPLRHREGSGAPARRYRDVGLRVGWPTSPHQWHPLADGTPRRRPGKGPRSQ